MTPMDHLSLTLQRTPREHWSDAWLALRSAERRVLRDGIRFDHPRQSLAFAARAAALGVRQGRRRDARSSRTRTVPLPAALPARTDPDRVEALDEARRALRSLPAPLAQTARLAAMNGNVRAGRALGITDEAVRQRLARARRILEAA